eukprot:UN27065
MECFIKKSETDSKIMYQKLNVDNKMYTIEVKQGDNTIEHVKIFDSDRRLVGYIESSYFLVNTKKTQNWEMIYYLISL